LLWSGASIHRELGVTIAPGRCLILRGSWLGLVWKSVNDATCMSRTVVEPSCDWHITTGDAWLITCWCNPFGCCWRDVAAKQTLIYATYLASVVKQMVFAMFCQRGLDMPWHLTHVLCHGYCSTKLHRRSCWWLHNKDYAVAVLLLVHSNEIDSIAPVDSVLLCFSYESCNCQHCPALQCTTEWWGSGCGCCVQQVQAAMLDLGRCTTVCSTLPHSCNEMLGNVHIVAGSSMIIFDHLTGSYR